MNQQYEFCPRCGALMREGVCQSCEFTTNVNPTINPNINPNINLQMQNPQQVPNYGQGYVNPQQAPNYNQGYVNPQQAPNYNQGYVNPQQASNYNYVGLRSTCFDVEYSDGEFTVTCRGYGHGVGMSQYGADYMARQGSTWQEILKHYYTGVEITE